MDRRDAQRLRLVALAALALAGCGGASKPGAGSGASGSKPSAPSSGAATTSAAKTPSTATAPRATKSTATRSPATSLPKASTALIASADAICTRFDSRLIASPTGRVDLSAIARSAPRNAALEQQADAELSKLIPPVGMARDWLQILTYRRTLADELVKLGQAAGAGDQTAVLALSTSKKRVHEELFKLARRDGFKSCAQATTASGAAKRPAGKENTATTGR